MAMPAVPPAPMVSACWRSLTNRTTLGRLVAIGGASDLLTLSSFRRKPESRAVELPQPTHAYSDRFHSTDSKWANGRATVGCTPRTSEEIHQPVLKNRLVPLLCRNEIGPCCTSTVPQ